MSADFGDRPREPADSAPIQPVEPPEVPARDGSEPRIVKSEGIEHPDIWQEVSLDRRRAEADEIVASNEVMRKVADAQIRDQDEGRGANLRGQDERRATDIKSQESERVDRRVERYVAMGVFLLGAIAAVVLVFVTLGSSEMEHQVSPSVGVIVSAGGGLRLRALSGDGARVKKDHPGG
jgi:hypothetical protein